jgi:hypothetical protein
MPDGQQIATPPFLPGQIPGIGSGGGVPVIPPAGPQGGAPAPQTGDPGDKVKQILEAIKQVASRKQVANTAVPMSIPAGGDVESARNIGMNTANPHAWGTQRFLATLGASIKNGVKAQKEKQLLSAEGDWTYLQAALNEKFQADQTGDPQAIAAAQKKIDAITGDPKKLKNMAKALNQDWLNPEKTTVYGEALKKVTAKQQQEDKTKAQKEQAASGLKRMFQHLIQKAQGGQKPQLSDEQRTAMGREIQEKAPTTQGVTDPKVATEMMRAEAELIRAEKANPEKYDVKTISDPKDPTGRAQILVATDKTDPTKPYIEIKSSTGEKARPGEKKYVGDGKLEVLQGSPIPTGRVQRGGVWISPGDPRYTKDDENAVALGMKAENLSEKQKERLQAIRGESFARSRAQYTFKDVVDTTTGEVREVSAMDMAREPGRYTGASEQEKVAARDAVHRSLNTNFDAVEKDLKGLPNGLDTETQAIVKLALKGGDPGLIDTLIVNKIKSNAPDETLRLLTDYKALAEDSMTLRSVGGITGSSDTLRAAMVAMVPGAGTGSVKEGLMQLKAARRTTEALLSGRPKSALPGGSDTGTVKYKDGATTYEIPADEEKAFLKDKPNAKKVQ